MAELERYTDADGKYAWRMKKKVDDIVEQVAAPLPKEVLEAEASEKPKRRRRK